MFVKINKLLPYYKRIAWNFFHVNNKCMKYYARDNNWQAEWKEVPRKMNGHMYI